MSKVIVAPPQPISLADVSQQAERALRMMENIRSAMLAPSARKSPPTFNLRPHSVHPFQHALQTTPQ